MKQSHVRIFYLFAILSAVSIFSSCKDTVSTTTGAPGNIVGFVQIYDSLSQVMNDASGVKVSVPGTSFSATSDATGRWQLSNVPPGTYKLLFSKPGCSSYEDFNIAFQGNGTLYYDFGLAKPPSLSQLRNLYPDIVLRPFEDNINIQDSTYYDDTTGYYHYVYDTIVSKYYSAVFSSRSQVFQGYSYYVSSAIYFGKSKNIDPMDGKTFRYVSNLTNNSSGYDSTGIADITIYRSDLLKSGFSSGDSIYCAAFAGMANILNSTSWVDPETNKIVYTGFSPHHSDVVSFILP